MLDDGRKQVSSKEKRGKAIKERKKRVVLFLRRTCARLGETDATMKEGAQIQKGGRRVTSGKKGEQIV